MNLRYYRVILAVTAVSLFTLPVLAAEISGRTMRVVMEGRERTIAVDARAAHDSFLIASK